MEEDDEFGDLYTDVLRSSTTSSSAAASQQPSVPPPQSSSAPPAGHRPADLNINSDDEEILYGAPNSRTNPNLNTLLSSQINQTLVPVREEPRSGSIVDISSDSHRNLYQQVSKELVSAGGGLNLEVLDSAARVLKKSGDVEEAKIGFEDPNFVDESGLDVVVEERDEKEDVLVKKDDNLLGKRENFDNLMGGNQNFDADTGVGEMGPESMIPGLSIRGVSGAVDNQGDPNLEDDWDSDSEDDLQIVLNDNEHGPMAMDRGGMMGLEDDDDEDEDGEPLVIVADSENPNHQPMMDEQEWGGDVAQGVDLEKKELGDGAKLNGGVAAAPKIGYGSHGYHPYHSQFKYVRPGAAPIPGAPLGAGGAPGQVRPPASMVPMVGRGRGDWRPTGIKNAPGMQKNFHPGYGTPVWGSNAGRGFGSGLEFTLPSHKTIFEVDIDSFEEKPWRHPNIDISDYFNFGLNEESWKDYCKQLEQLRLEATMQSRIRVYESGRTEQEYDPDLPPELAAAAGIHDISSENAIVAKTDPGQSDLTKGSARVRPPLPTGRAIQVETGYGERLPSIDTRPPRIRDSDSIIEIVLQDSVDDDSYTGNDLAERPENGPSRRLLVGRDEIEVDIAKEEAEQCSFQHAYDGRQREFTGRRAAFTNSVHESATDGNGMPFPSEAPALIEHDPDSGGQTPSYHGRTPGIPHEERQMKGRAHVRSPNKTPSDGTRDKSFLDSHKEESVESVGGKQPAGHDAMHEEVVSQDRSPEGGSAHNTTTVSDKIEDENSMHSKKKQKLNSQVEQPSSQDIDDVDSNAARSSDNSKARSGSSKDYWKLGDGVDDDIVQGGHSTRTGKIKRPLSEDEQNTRRNVRDERQEIEKLQRDAKAREDSYTRKNRDPNTVRHSHLNMQSVDKRRTSDHSDVALSMRDDDPNGKRAGAEDARKLECGDEMGSRHRTKLRESERSDKDEHHLRKHLENGSWGIHHDKGSGSQHRDREDNMKSRNDSMDDVRSKRRKEEAQLRRRHAEKEELLHSNRESTSRRKRERDEALDQRKRGDPARIREDDQHSVRHKEEGWYQKDRSERQRERDEWLRHKQSHEENLSRREREEGRRVVRTGQAGEDKAWPSHSRVKDDYKSSDRDFHPKDTGKHSEHLKRKDCVENEIVSQHRGRDEVYGRGNLVNNDDRRARPERASARADRGVNVTESHRGHEKYYKENTRKAKESEGVDRNSSSFSKRNQEDHSGQINETVTLKGRTEQRSGEHDVPLNHQSSKKPRESASDDDERQDAKRGRSKLERWMSHEERNFGISTKSSSSLKIREIDMHNIGGVLGCKISESSSKTKETVEAKGKDANEPDNKNVDAGPAEDKHLDTVAKLKKRSERFKLPMPSEKEAVTIKKMENEPLHLVQGEMHVDSEIKGRPARKRRWTSN